MQANSLDEAFQQICATEAPLHERMAAFSEAVREFGLPFAAAYDDLVARIRSGEAGRTARLAVRPALRGTPLAPCNAFAWLVVRLPTGIQLG